MKKFSLRLFCLLILVCVCLALPAAAEGNFVSDEAHLLTESDIASINEAAARVYDEHGIAVFVVTVDSLGGKDLVDTADLMLESTGVQEGLLLFLSMEERDYAISTFGDETIWYFNDYNLQQMESVFIPYLSNGNYAMGFEKFVTLSGDVITYEKEHANDDYEGSNYVPTPPKIFSPVRLVVCFAIGLLLAGIPVSGYKRALKSVAKKTNASDYVREGSMQVTTANDIFLYRHVNAIPRAVNNNPGGRTGGSRPGGTTHFSSSGMTHGGSHGKF